MLLVRSRVFRRYLSQSLTGFDSLGGARVRQNRASARARMLIVSLVFHLFVLDVFVRDHSVEARPSQLRTFVGLTTCFRFSSSSRHHLSARGQGTFESCCRVLFAPYETPKTVDRKALQVRRSPPRPNREFYNPLTRPP